MPVPSACFLLLPIAPMSSPEFHRHRRFAPFAWPARLGHAPLLPPCAPSPPTRAQPTRTFSAARRALLSHHGELGQSSNGTAAGAPPLHRPPWTSAHMPLLSVHGTAGGPASSELPHGRSAGHNPCSIAEKLMCLLEINSWS